MLVPNTFNPDSIELSSVLIAVITLMTEKIPTDIPKRVRVDLSLFARMASKVIRTLSRKILLIWLLKITFYSYLNASIGSSPAALYDGIRPAVIPTKMLNDIEVMASQIGIVEGKN